LSIEFLSALKSFGEGQNIIPVSSTYGSGWKISIMRRSRYISEGKTLARGRYIEHFHMCHRLREKSLDNTRIRENPPLGGLEEAFEAWKRCLKALFC